MYAGYLFSFTSETNVNNNQQEELGMIDLKPVNILMMKIEIIQPIPSPRPSTNLLWKQSCMSDFNMDHRQFANTPENKFQYK